MDSVDNCVFSTIWPLLTDEEWNRLENESFQNGIQVPQAPDQPDETEVGKFRTQTVGENSLGPEHPGPELEAVTEVRGDRVEGFGLDSPAPDEPEGHVDHCSGQNPQEADDPGETEVAQFSMQTVGTNFLGPEHPDTNAIFGSCLPLFADEEWNSLENEFSDLHPLGPDSKAENEVRVGVEGSRHNPPVPDQPGGNGDHISGQTPQEPVHPRESDVGKVIVQALGTNSLGPEHPETNSIFSSCLPLFTDEEWNRLENEFSDSHPLGPDSEEENEVIHGVEGSSLNPSVPDEPGGNGDHFSGQTPQQPDHPRENEVGELVVQAVGINSLGPGYPMTYGEGENLPHRSKHAPPANCRKRRGRPRKHPELPPVVPDAAENPQNLPKQESTQHSGHPRQKRGLPNGWTTEVKVRKNGRSAGNKDKTYIEQSTKKRCRSLQDVWRYIEKKRKLE